MSSKGFFGEGGGGLMSALPSLADEDDQFIYF